MNVDAMTIGILYPGEMGAVLASVLRAGGLRVVTTLGGRSGQTVRRCHHTGIESLASFRELVRQSNVVLSVVSPAAAQDVADLYREVADLAPQGALYVDLNSIRPELAVSLSDEFADTNVDFVDGSINGLAKHLTTSGTLFLSGSRANEVAELFNAHLRVKLLGSEVGRASSMKMLLAGVSKGVCALFAELSLQAHRQGMLDELLAETSHIYPDIAALTNRMLPTYAQHAARRATEMQELEQTARSAGSEPCVIAAVREFHELLADASAEFPHDDKPMLGLAELIERFNAAGLLSPLREGRA
jgi:3-hydroxyisobutyrate dehydrogenase-like beta-hydroxyacid dehydrogenase